MLKFQAELKRKQAVKKNIDSFMPAPAQIMDGLAVRVSADGLSECLSGNEDWKDPEIPLECIKQKTQAIKCNDNV